MIIKFLIIFLIGEIIAIPVFRVVSKTIGKVKKDRISITSIFKGSLERFFLLLCLVLDLVQGLTLFGALKIATRIKDDDKVSNDYFFVGNLISVLFVIAYFQLYSSERLNSILNF